MIRFGHMSLTDKYPNQTPKIKVSGSFSSSTAKGTFILYNTTPFHLSIYIKTIAKPFDHLFVAALSQAE